MNRRAYKLLYLIVGAIFSITSLSCGSAAAPPPQDIIVVPEVTTPVIKLDPQSLSFTFNEGDTSTQSKNVYVMNDGGGVLIYAARKTADWLWIDEPDGATEKGMSKKIQVFVTPSGFKAGTYNETISVSGQGATNSPQNIQVTMVIAPAPAEAGGQDLQILKKAVPPPPWEYNEYKNDNYNFVLRYPKNYKVLQSAVGGMTFYAVAEQGTAQSNDIMINIRPHTDLRSATDEWAKDVLRMKGAKANLKVITNEEITLADGVTPANEILYESKTSGTQSYQCYALAVAKRNRWIIFGAISLSSNAAENLPRWKEIARTLEFLD